MQPAPLSRDQGVGRAPPPRKVVEGGGPSRPLQLGGSGLPGVLSRVVVWSCRLLVCVKRRRGPHLSGVRTPVLASRTPWLAWDHLPGAAAIAVTPPRPLSAQGHARRCGIQVQLSLGLMCASPHSGPRFLCMAPCLPRLRLRCLCPLPGRMGSQGARVIGSSEEDVI